MAKDVKVIGKNISAWEKEYPLPKGCSEVLAQIPLMEAHLKAITKDPAHKIFKDVMKVVNWLKNGIQTRKDLVISLRCGSPHEIKQPTAFAQSEALKTAAEPISKSTSGSSKSNMIIFGIIGITLVAGTVLMLKRK